MKISLYGVETNNKGAELMLYAILQEIERRYPNAKVYLPFSRIKQGVEYVKTNLDFRTTPFSKFAVITHLQRILFKLHLSQNIYTRTLIVRDADWFIDGSGFAFGDQWDINKMRIKMWENMLKPLHNRNCKIVFLPQAFGPVEKPNTRKILSVLNKYANILMPREQVSYNYLKESGVVDMQKVRKITDFTSLVEGEFPLGYEPLKNGICIIPNRKMITQGKISYDDYILLLSSFIKEGKKSGHPVYLLNHEGPKDAELCIKCKESIGGDIVAVTGLNALQVKGLIASAYLVITSRFHGLASALNSCVPVLATSWSHKYEELYRDYELDGYVLPLNNHDTAMALVKRLIEQQNNKRIRQHLALQVPKVKAQTQKMWDLVWNL